MRIGVDKVTILNTTLCKRLHRINRAIIEVVFLHAAPNINIWLPN
jgi:hypothetical protein